MKKFSLFIVLAISLLFITNVQAENCYIPMNLSFEQIVGYFDAYFTFKTYTDTKGYERYVGSLYDNSMIMEITGPKENICQAKLMINSHTSYEKFQQNIMAIPFFIQNSNQEYWIENKEDKFMFVILVLQNLFSTMEEQVIRAEDKIIIFNCYPDVVIVTIEQADCRGPKP